MKLGRTTIAVALLTACAFPVHATVEWFGRAEAAGVYSDSGLEDDGSGLSSASSLGLRGAFGVETTDIHGSTRVEVTSRYVDYRDDRRRDRFSNELELRRRFNLSGDWLLDIIASAASNIWTVEAPFADQWGVQTRATYRPEGQVRLRGYLGYLQRYYDDAGRTRGEGFQVGGDYRYRSGPNTVDVDADHLVVNADNGFYDNERTTLTAAYTRRFNPKFEGSLGVRARRTVYDNRPADPLTGSGERRDWSVRPEVVLTYMPSDPFEVALSYRYTNRDSNDDARDVDDQSVGLRFTYRF